LNVCLTGVQEKIKMELEAAGLLFGTGSCGGNTEEAPGRQLELDDLKKLPYLTACIKESMRMFPVVSIMSRSDSCKQKDVFSAWVLFSSSIFFHRVTQRPTKIGKYLIPEGTPVVVPLYAIHNTKHSWENPGSFVPERWLNVPLESWVLGPGTNPGIIYMPFSEGPRNCVGQTLAKLEVTAVLAKILANFHVQLATEVNA
jgi:cytochrome P450